LEFVLVDDNVSHAMSRDLNIIEIVGLDEMKKVSIYKRMKRRE